VDDPAERQRALGILGGVEPSAQAPTWAPTDEQLAVVRDDLKDTFRNLPYDEREDLSANTPEFINKYLSNQKFQQDLIAKTQQAEAQEQQRQQREFQQQRQQAENAGHEYVEKQFRQGFTEFANSIVERSNFIQTLTPEMAQPKVYPERPNSTISKPSR
jgi:flagellar biosynthesis/type III secretory pathway protein FliH